MMKAGHAFIVAKLAADSQLTTLVPATRHYADLAPENAQWPVVVFQNLAANITRANANIALGTFVYRVKGIAQQSGTTGSSLSDLFTIQDRIKEALHKATGRYQSHYVECVLESEFSLPELQAGVLFRHLGGDFRIDVHAV